MHVRTLGPLFGTRSVLTTELVQSASRGADDAGAAEGDEALQFNIDGVRAFS